MSTLPSTLVTVAEDLDSVTTVGGEDDPGAAGLTPRSVDALWESVRDWYRMGTTPAIQVCLRRNGKIVLNRAIGHGWGNAPGDGADTAKVLATPETPFCGFSTAKGVSAALMFMLIERGAFGLDDPVSRYIPEFAANGKERITIGHVLSHSAGVPFVTPPYRGFELVVDEELAVRGLADLVPSWPPGRFRIYHALTSGLIQRLLVQRATGKRMREHLAEQVLEPLGFRWNNFGVRPEDVDQVVAGVKTGPGPSRISKFLARKALGGGMSGTVSDAATRTFLAAELPSGNLVTTAFELSRFYEILGNGGELDGVRVMRPSTLREAIQPANRIPGLAGRVSRAGFELGGRKSKFGSDTPTHFGRSGLTTQYGWADPARGLSGAILTSGKATTDTQRPWRLVAQISDTVAPGALPSWL
ncbi:CubicO group peptidase (beta-lactamase class C family) [Nocardia tenerifensis]|uniref:CubicO group peptidase (Beta-lactamase class C family) n=1 Tax=Nocardia tenerifensis TaxID=228006 RepID=A0A318K210_9NOCA|nr:serine hydrolase [Nocardia tenerifensis]PXX65069.1 CubicO group peptidase (beta-lactamase class C family) [Nocardia tenerifensis]